MRILPVTDTLSGSIAGGGFFAEYARFGGGIRHGPETRSPAQSFAFNRRGVEIQTWT
jgi:hypothetical protein